MLSCKDISFLVSESLDRKLSLREQLSLKTHIVMCKACKRIAQQMVLLREASHRITSIEGDEARPTQDTLSKEASARILEQLKYAAHNPVDHK